MQQPQIVRGDHLWRGTIHTMTVPMPLVIMLSVTFFSLSAQFIYPCRKINVQSSGKHTFILAYHVNNGDEILIFIFWIFFLYRKPSKFRPA